jgi:acyl carrier protein
MSVEAAQSAEEAELARLIAITLNLTISPESIVPDAPLFYEGLGLDSIDILEIALAISQVYGFKLRADDEENGKIFSSLRNLTNHVQTHRVK